MTNEEAIKQLESFLNKITKSEPQEKPYMYGWVEGYMHLEDREALNMAIEALKRDAINMGETVTSGYIEPVGEDAPTIATTVEYPCEDVISRQQALEAFGLSEKTRKYGGDHSGYDTIMLYEVQDILENLPSVQPKIPPITITMNEPCMRG